MAKKLRKKKSAAAKRAKTPTTQAVRMATARGKTRIVIIDPFPGDDPWELPKGRRPRRS